MSLKLSIVTPETVAFADQVDSVVLPGFDGELGVLESHVPLVTNLQPGELVFRKSGKEVHLAVGEGFVEITQHEVNVLADLAIEEEGIQEDMVEKALQSAQKALEDKGADHTPEEVAALQASIAKSLAQLKVKRRRRSV